MAWDPSPNSNVIGYVVHYGGTSGNYPSATNVSNQTSARMTGLQSGQTYFFAVTARDSLGMESVPSNEVSYQVPVTNLPTVALTSPLNGAAYTPPASINLAASVAANGHTITKVQFYNGATLLGEDTSSPYSYTWSSVNAGTYSLMARVIYDTGGTVDSTAANVVVANPPPTIALTSPIGGATFISPATISLSASVASNGHTITKVQFYSGSTLMGEDASSPYSFACSNVSAGTYSMMARAVYDSGSTVDSTASTVTVSNPAGTGTMTFSNPTAITIGDVGAATPYPSTINVSGTPGTISQLTVTLNNLTHTWTRDIDILLVGPGGQKMMLMSDAGSQGANNVTLTFSDAAGSSLPATASLVSSTFRPTDYTDASAGGDNFPAPAPTAPYATALSAFNGLTANGTWSLYVYDDGPGDQGILGNGWSLAITTTAPTDTAPTISDIAAQSTGANTPTAPIPFTVNDAETPASGLSLTAASSNPTLVPNANVVFGGSTSYRTVTVTPASGLSGSATITVTVTDANSNSASDTFILTVTNSLPTVALTSPLSGASYSAPATINLTANVTANGHTISKVRFYNGTILIAEDATSPYSFAWGNVAAGSYSVTAQVIYDSGGTVTSSAANVAVTNPPPVVALISPSAGANYTAPATINVVATVTPNGHSITKVQFYNGAALLGESTNAPYSLAWTSVGIGNYTVTARALYDSGGTADSSPVNVAVTILSPPWQTANIGIVALTGNASESNGVFTVAGSGNIASRSDSFRFVYQTLSADGDISARINSIATNGINRCVGVMIRESLAPNSKYVFMGIGQNLKFRWQRRSNTGGNTSSTTSVLATPPNAWARLLRTNDTLTSYSSTNGVNWTKLTSVSGLTMATNIYVGFVVASGNTNTLNTSVFSNVSVTP